MIDEIHQRIRTCRSGNEQGGLLLGYRKESALQITSYTLPQKWDYATPFLFKRNTRGHKKLAHDEWRRSGKTVDWLGEWHTHPGGTATPSITDRRSWQRLVRHTKKPMTFLIFSDHEMYAGLQQLVPASLRQLDKVEENEEAILLGFTS
jgi:integrative and conjugative element protein (TIGR02256 family)